MNKLHTDAINETSPYKVEITPYGEYQFVTNTGIIYRVGFLNDETIQSCECYQFYITKETLRHSTKDDKIKYCILAILEEFFRQNVSVLLYMCDTADGREAARNRLFLQWFNTTEKRTSYICKCTNMQIEGIEMYAAIIIRKDNPSLTSVVEEFDETVALLSEKP